MKHALPSIGILLFAIFLFVGPSEEISAQPVPVVIGGIDPNQLYPGTVVKVSGGPFLEINGDFGSIVYFMDLNAPVGTHFESSSALVFVVPVGEQLCGTRAIMVKNYVNLNNQPTPLDSNPVIHEIKCPNPNNIQPANPEIDDVTLLDPLLGHSIEITGENLIPELKSHAPVLVGGTSYPYTEIRMYNDDHEFAGRGEYRSFGVMRFNIDEDLYCGTYKVEAKNYISSNLISPVSPSSNSATVDIYERCIGGNNGAPPENGVATGYEVMRLSLPDTAHVDERIEGNVQIKHTGSYAARADMQLYVNGERKDTQEILISGDETKSYPLSFRFDRPGDYEIEIRVNESYKKKSIEVSSQNGTSPPPAGGGALKDYDLDGNCTLSDTEFFNITDAWISESVSDLLFFSAVDAWIGQSSVCAAAASTSSIELKSTPRGILLSMRGGDSLGQISVYDINGNQIFESYEAGTKLFWKMQNELGDAVANGIYFIRFGKTGELRKFVVMR